MPKGRRAENRPTDVIGNAVHVMRIATGIIVNDKNAAAVELGRRGGAARAAKLTPERRSEIARLGATKRWER